MIRVEVRNLEGFNEVFQRLFFSPIDKGTPQRLFGQHSQEVILLCNGPDAGAYWREFVRSHPRHAISAGRISGVFRMI